MNIFKKRKAKRMIIGLNSLSAVSDKIKLLDQVLELFDMKVGAESVTVDCSGTVYDKVVLTVYFVK